jgi:hypothetical protein
MELVSRSLLLSFSVIAQPINYYPLIYLRAVGLALGGSIITDINYVWFRNVVYTLNLPLNPEKKNIIYFASFSVSV